MQPKHLLSGVVVVDFTQFLAGPSVSQAMAELGAEVIKIESAPGGDPGRYLPLQRDGRSGYFVQQNTAKEGLCVDLRQAEGKALVNRLLQRADVMVENFSPGVIDKLGFGWDAVHALNPRLVMASVSALRQDGPLAKMPGFDFTGQPIRARGFAHHTGKPAPLLGEHNAEVLKRHLGLGDADVARLTQAGVLAAARV